MQLTAAHLRYLLAIYEVSRTHLDISSRSIAEKLPYIDIEDIWIRRELPDTLLIDVAECGTPLAVIQDLSLIHI